MRHWDITGSGVVSAKQGIISFEVSVHTESRDSDLVVGGISLSDGRGCEGVIT